MAQPANLSRGEQSISSWLGSSCELGCACWAEVAVYWAAESQLELGLSGASTGQYLCNGQLKLNMSSECGVFRAGCAVTVHWAAEAQLELGVYGAGTGK